MAAQKQHFKTQWRARTYGDRVVTGVQLRSFGQSTWLDVSELRCIARELDRLADDHDSASTAEIPQSRPNRKKVQP
ncbi:hypothetical protein [Pseudoclavibacter helvolus]|uniref:hypothetical protein n=1 Tax=Pseudoclavibacter helvolus TaxID=255205 RepID=UPI0024AC8B37|nr:hypothetical protein [Pseudoclavibacter helvolus]